MTRWVKFLFVGCSTGGISATGRWLANDRSIKEQTVSEIPSTGAFAIIPSNDLAAAVPFWERLGFARTGGDDNYILMRGWGCEVHLTQAGDGEWRVPEEHNPFGVFIRTPEVDAIAARVDDLIIRPGGVLRHREWGLYEVGICGPDGMLVRIGWPSRLIRQTAG
jgi:hypothetical protein